MDTKVGKGKGKGKRRGRSGVGGPLPSSPSLPSFRDLSFRTPQSSGEGPTSPRREGGPDEVLEELTIREILSGPDHAMMVVDMLHESNRAARLEVLSAFALPELCLVVKALSERFSKAATRVSSKDVHRFYQVAVAAALFPWGSTVGEMADAIGPRRDPRCYQEKLRVYCNWERKAASLPCFGSSRCGKHIHVLRETLRTLHPLSFEQVMIPRAPGERYARSRAYLEVALGGCPVGHWALRHATPNDMSRIPITFPHSFCFREVPSWRPTVYALSFVQDALPPVHSSETRPIKSIRHISFADYGGVWIMLRGPDAEGLYHAYHAFESFLDLLNSCFPSIDRLCFGGAARRRSGETPAPGSCEA